MWRGGKPSTRRFRTVALTRGRYGGSSRGHSPALAEVRTRSIDGYTTAPAPRGPNVPPLSTPGRIMERRARESAGARRGVPGTLATGARWSRARTPSGAVTAPARHAETDPRDGTSTSAGRGRGDLARFPAARGLCRRRAAGSRARCVQDDYATRADDRSGGHPRCKGGEGGASSRHGAAVAYPLRLLRYRTIERTPWARGHRGLTGGFRRPEAASIDPDTQHARGLRRGVVGSARGGIHMWRGGRSRSPPGGGDRRSRVVDVRSRGDAKDYALRARRVEMAKAARPAGVGAGSRTPPT